MARYYVLKCMSPIEAEHYWLEVDYPARGKRWNEGVLFSEKDWRDGFHPPLEPIEVETKFDEEPPPRVYPEYTSQPIPLMSRRLVHALRAAGVDNLQIFATKLTNPQGKTPPSDDYYLAVNIVGCVAAADLEKSKFNPEAAEAMIAMDFHSLSVAESKTRGALMFRLAENVSALLVHERVMQHVEASGITTLTWYAPEEWAG